MHYPWWYVPHVTAPMLIAMIAVVHVLVSHYAVGGGFFLAIETAFAYRRGDERYLAYLKRHARFFVLLTVVFGAITGVGIWWTIGLASPMATAMLIKTFVFGWAIEWVFFIVEITAAFLFYYLWGRLDEKTHVRIGWIYAWAAWISLVLITGITAFMLNPGVWLENKGFWVAFFNPQFIPQVVCRTGAALILTSLYVYLHAACFLKDETLRRMIASRATRPAFLGAVLLAVGVAGWVVYLPPSALAMLKAVPALNIFVALSLGATAAVMVLLYVGPHRNPGWLSPGFAASLFLMGLVAFSTGEFVREAVRKPYVIHNVVLGNQIATEEVASLRESGYLEGGVWTKAYVAHHYPNVVSNGKIDEARLLTLDPSDRVVLGQVLFQYHCNDCHAGAGGYSAAGPLVQGRSPELIEHLIENLSDVHYFMPPWAGTKEEAKILAEYLAHIAPPRPEGMRPVAFDSNSPTPLTAGR